MDLVEKRKRNRIKTTYTTGDIQKNIDHFNKMLTGKASNTHTDGLPNVELQKAAEDAAKSVGTFASQSPDGASSIAMSTTSMSSGGDMGESLNLDEAKREVRRYYIKPQNIFCASKTDILNALIDIDNNDCTIYTLINLPDNDDITKLTSKDIIYYYKDGILYDKNMVKVMDYQLYVKHEEQRKKIDTDSVSDATLSDVYHDRMTGEIENESLEENNMKESFNPDINTMIYDWAKEDAKLGQAMSSFEDFYQAAQDCGEEVSEDDYQQYLDYYDELLNESLDEAFNLAFESVNVYGERLREGKEIDKICCICGEEIEGYGNNPEPYMSAENGERCCDACNMHFVIPARIEEYRKYHSKN